jgi:hypothetical protein
MIVEKFIAKSAAPYKIPGFYVVDSIIRQSKHQYSGPKEVYGPRFQSRLDKIFPHILECQDSDKPKVAKVLKLWMKNNVYPSEILAPYIQMLPIEHQGSPQEQPSSSTNTEDKKETPQEEILLQNQGSIDTLILQQQEHLQNLLQKTTETEQSEALSTLIDKAKQLQELQSLQQTISTLNQTASSNDPVGCKLEDTKELINVQSKPTNIVTNEFSKALLDNFDYSSGEDDMMDIDNNNNNSDPINNNNSNSDPVIASNDQNDDPSAIIDELDKQFKMEKDLSTGVVVPAVDNQAPPASLHYPLPPVPPEHHYQDWPNPPVHHYQPPPAPSNNWRDDDWGRGPPHPPPSFTPPPLPPHMSNYPRDMYYDHYERDPPRFGERQFDERHSRGYRGNYRPLDEREDRYDRRRRRDDRHHGSRRDRSPLHEDKAPQILPERIVVYSTTIWLGHLSKAYSEDELKEKIQTIGPVKSVDCIAARGCAYVVMENRKDSVKAIHNLKDILDLKCKIAWAPGRGVKGKTYHSYWEESEGLSQIPWNLVKTKKDLETLGVGGWTDISTAPPHLK